MITTQLVFIILKLIKVISWGWNVVFIPGIVFLSVVFAILFLGLLLKIPTLKKEKKPENKKDLKLEVDNGREN